MTTCIRCHRTITLCQSNENDCMCPMCVITLHDNDPDYLADVQANERIEKQYNQHLERQWQKDN